MELSGNLKSGSFTLSTEKEMFKSSIMPYMTLQIRVAQIIQSAFFFLLHQAVLVQARSFARVSASSAQPHWAVMASA